jgi:PGF-pre-PGF domain-containing protein
MEFTYSEYQKKTILGVLMLKRTLILSVLFLIILSSVGFSAACSLGADYTQISDNSSCDSITTNGYTWDTAGFDFSTTGTLTVSDGGVFQGRTGEHAVLDVVIDSGGVLNSTNGNLTLTGGNFDNNNGASGFVHNEGLVKFNSSSNEYLYSGNAVFYNLELKVNGRILYIWNEPLTVINSLNNTGGPSVSWIDHYRDDGQELIMGNSTQSGIISTHSAAKFKITGSNTIKANNSLYPVIVVGVDWTLPSGAKTNFWGGINFTILNVTTGGGGRQINLDDDCWFNNVTVTAGDTFNISSVVNVEFLDDLLYHGDMTLEGNITLLSGLLNVTNNTVVNGVLNASQSSATYFTNLTLNTNGVYHATSGVTTIYEEVNIFDENRWLNNSGVVVHSPTIDVNLNYTNSSLNYLNLTSKNYTAISDIFVKHITIDSGTNLSINSGVTVFYCNLFGLGTTGGLGVFTSYCLDSAASIVNIESPVNNTIYGYSESVEIGFNVSKETDSVVDCDLFVDDTAYGVANDVFNETSVTLTANTTVAIGSYDWYVNCTDSAGNIGQSETRRMSIIDHNITLVSPTPGNSTSTTDYNIEINTSIYESDLDTIKFNWNGTNYTLYDNSLILDYNFDNNDVLGENDTHVVDISMQSSNGTISGGSVGVDGRYDGGYCLSGSSGDIILGDVESLKLANTNFSLSMWVNLNTSDTVHLIGRELDWLLQISDYSYSFLINGTAQGFLAGDHTSNKRWGHVAVTYVNGTNETVFYVNGELDSTVVMDEVFTTTTVDGVVIGADARTASGYELSGCIDNVRIWNRTLTAGDVRQQYYSNVKKYSGTEWGAYVNRSFTPYMRNVSGNYSYNVYIANATMDVNQTGQMSIEKLLPEISSSDISICHYKDCKYAVSISSGDGNEYSLYSDVYKAYENNNNLTGKDYVYTFDIDTKCYREGGGCTNGNKAPASIEIKELFWEGHAVVFDGYNHNGTNDYPFSYDATGNATRQAAILGEYLNGSEAFYYNLTGVSVITGFMPWSNNHRTKYHGEIAFENTTFVIMKDLQNGGYYPYDLIIPETAANSYISYGTNSRDKHDLYEQAIEVYNRGNRYSHIFGHSNPNYDRLVNNLTAFSDNSTLNDYYWSASMERVARYIIERDSTTLTEVDMTGDPKELSLSTSYNSSLNTTIYGQDVYVMPLTINASGYSDYPFVYESVDGVLTRLYSYTRGNDFLFEVIPNNQTIYMYSTIQQTSDKPFINMTVSYLSVLNTTGDSVRGGEVYEVLVSANDSNSQYTNWSMTVINSTGGEYLNWLNHSVNNTQLDMNDRLNNERGKILYYNEKGYTNATLFQFIGNLTNADGESRSLNLTNVNGTISFGMVNDTTALVSTYLSQNVSVTLDGFNSSRVYNVSIFDSTRTVLNTTLYTNPLSGSINFNTDLSGVSSIDYFELNDTGEYCTIANDCGVDYCVNNYCSDVSTYCGDGVCEGGESYSTCSADCEAPEASTDTTTPSGGFTQCMDRLDNDGDGLVDMNDPGCSRSGDDSENSEGVVEQVIREVVDTVLKNVTKGETVEIDVVTQENETGVITGVSIVSGEDAVEGSFEVKEYNTAPVEVSQSVRGYKITATRDVQMNKTEEEYTVYQYVEVETDVEIESAVLEFEVSKEWMDIQGAGKDDVMLLHFTNDEWVELETVYLGGDDPLLFEAQTGSFSVFAVGVRAPVVGYSVEWYGLVVVILAFLGIVGWVLVGKGNKLVRKSRK